MNYEPQHLVILKPYFIAFHNKKRLTVPLEREANNPFKDPSKIYGASQ